MRNGVLINYYCISDTAFVIFDRYRCTFDRIISFPNLPEYRYHSRYRQYRIDFVFEKQCENKSDLVSYQSIPIVFILNNSHSISAEMQIIAACHQSSTPNSIGE